MTSIGTFICKVPTFFFCKFLFRENSLLSLLRKSLHQFGVCHVFYRPSVEGSVKSLHVMAFHPQIGWPSKRILRLVAFMFRVSCPQGIHLSIHLGRCKRNCSLTALGTSKNFRINKDIWFLLFRFFFSLLSFFLLKQGDISAFLIGLHF